MENKMSFDFMLSLEEIAMRRVAINLWNHPDILVSIENFSKVSPKCCNYSEIWRETVEYKVIDKLSKLVIPASLLKQLLPIVTPIGLQILRWKVYHECYLEMPGSKKVSLSFPPSKYLKDSMHLLVGLGEPVLEKLSWTAAGTIDNRQTAEELIRCEMVDLEKRYRLACLYCLEDWIPLFWEELPEGVKRKYYKEGKISRIKSWDLPHCWPYILKGEQSKLERVIQRKTGNQSPFNQILSSDAARDGNKVATEFFFQRLSNKGKDVSFFTKQALIKLEYRPLSIDVPVNSGNVLCYLLSLMDYEQQMEIIQRYPMAVLICFLDWPWHNIILKIADMIWNFLSTEKYDCLLSEISQFFRYYNYSYPKFFQEFFTHSPIDFKKRFVDYECRLGEFFPRLFDIQDSETIEVVLRNIDTAGRVRLVSSEHIFKLFYDCISKEGWHMVEVCLREAKLSIRDRERLEEAFMGFLKRCDGWRIKKSTPVWMRFFGILDEIGVISQGKRISEVETQRKAKKLRSDELESSANEISL